MSGANGGGGFYNGDPNTGYSYVGLSSTLGSPLQQLLMCEAISPGDEAGYQLCKTIYLFHPLGKKMAENPISLAQSQEREIAVPKGPEEFVRDEFVREWKRREIDKVIYNSMRISRIYGASATALIVKGQAPNVPIRYETLAKSEISFNVLDPLSVAGSLVTSLDPNSADFQKSGLAVRVGGKAYHPTRVCVKLNEEPIYLGWTSSAFGYVGRSVYQRSLFPLKTFVQSMLTDDLVTKKAGVLVAAMKGAGSIVDRATNAFQAVKRVAVKLAMTGNVISILPEERIETLNMQNADTAMTVARKNALENCAAGADMPAKILNNETFADGFGEGTEDSKQIANWVNHFRNDMNALYGWFDKIVMYLAWTPEFYKIVQEKYPKEYGTVSYQAAFYDWSNSFSASWPSLLTEPPSKLVEVDKVKLEAIISLMTEMIAAVKGEPTTTATVLQWACDNFNELKHMFTSPLLLDLQAVMDHLEVAVQQEADAAEAALAPPEPAEGPPGASKPAAPKGLPKADSATIREMTRKIMEMV